MKLGLTIDTDTVLTPKSLANEDQADFISEIHSINPKFTIPNDYKEFMFKYNGGSFLECMIKNTLEGDLILNWVCSWDRDDEMSLHVVLDHSELIKEGFLAFADDPGGNEFLLNLNEHSNGEVYYWSHDRNLVNGKNKILIANSFSDFLNRLDIE